MTAPATGLRLFWDTQGVRQGADDWKRAVEDVKQAGRELKTEVQAVTQQSTALATSQEVAAVSSAELAAKAAAAEQALRKMGLTDAEVAAGLQKMGLAGAQAAASVGAAAAASGGAGEQANRASPHLTKLQNALQAAALSAGGIPGPLGRVGAILGGLVGGGGVAVLAAAAISAVALAIRHAKEEAEQARKPIDDFLERMDQLAKSQVPGGIQAAFDVITARAGVGEAQAKVDKLQQSVERFRADLGYVPKALTKNLADAQAELERFQRAERTATTALNQANAEVAAKRQQADEAAARRREQLHRDELARIKAEADAWFAFQAALTQFNTPPVPTVTNTAGQRFQAAAAPPSTAVQDYTRAFERFNAAGLKLIDTSGSLEGKLKNLNDAEKRREDQTKRETQAAIEAALAHQQLVQALAEAARGVAQLGVQLGLFDDQTGQFLGNLASLGVAAATGDVAGIVTGAVATVGSAIGLAGGGERDTAQFAEAVREFHRSVQDFATGSRSAYEQAIQGLTDTYDQLVRQAANLYGQTSAGLSPDEIATGARGRGGRSRGRREAQQFLDEFDYLTETLTKRKEETRAEFQKDLDATKQEFEARKLLTEGHGAEAKAILDQLDIDRQLTALRRQYGPLLDEETEALIASTLAREKEIEALQKQAEINASLQTDTLTAEADIAELTGRGKDARELRRQARDAAREARQQAEIQQALADGYTEAQLAGLEYLHGLQDQIDTLKDAAQAAEDAARAMDFNTDIEERRLRLEGKDREADIYHQERIRDKQVSDAQKLFDEGIISQEDFTKAVGVYNDEFDKFVAGLTDSSQALAAAAGATEAATAVKATVTDRTALMLVDIDRQQLDVLVRIEGLLGGRGITTPAGVRPGGAPAGGVIVNIYNRLAADFTDADVDRLVIRIRRKLDEVFGRDTQSAQIFTGDVSRT